MPTAKEIREAVNRVAGTLQGLLELADQVDPKEKVQADVEKLKAERASLTATHEAFVADLEASKERLREAHQKNLADSRKSIGAIEEKITDLARQRDDLEGRLTQLRDQITADQRAYRDRLAKDEEEHRGVLERIIAERNAARNELDQQRAALRDLHAKMGEAVQAP